MRATRSDTMLDQAKLEWKLSVEHVSENGITGKNEDLFSTLFAQTSTSWDRFQAQPQKLADSL